MKKKVIIAYAFDESRMIFFERFRAALGQRGIELVVVSNRPALGRRNLAAQCLSRPRTMSADDDALIRNSLEYCVGNRDRRSASRLCRSLDEFLEDVRRRVDIVGAFIWNGSGLAERVITRFAKGYGIATAYFENSNIPGRMIVDSEGVNAQCSVARDPCLLDLYSSALSEEEFENWKRGYIADQMRSHKVHQASSVRRVNWSFLSDILSQWRRGIPQYETYPFLTKALLKLDALFYRPPNRHLDNLPERFVFFPIQVESDTQLIFNSDLGNEEALKIVSSRLEPGQKLVVKQHPAEPNKQVQRRYARIVARIGGIEADNNTFELMQAAEKVYTINSTAGLQAKLMGKPVECLGRAVFAQLDDKALNRYIHGFLASIEFFDTNHITEAQLEDLFSRCFPHLIANLAA